MKCTECDGRGWHVGECHPRETCGVCMGLGTDELPVMKRERDRFEKALREIAGYSTRSTGSNAADARDMVCIAEAALSSGKAGGA